MPAPQRLTRGQLRHLLQRVLPTSSDQDAFVLDFFPDIYRHFSAGMDRTQKVNLLFEHLETDEILAALEQFAPDVVVRHLSQISTPTPLATPPHDQSSEPGSKPQPEPAPGVPHMVCLYSTASDRDRDAYLDLRKYLAPKLRAGSLTLWSQADTGPGESYAAARTANLERAAVVVLLVSADLLADSEMDEVILQVLKHRTEGRCLVVPVLIGPAAWQSSRFGSLQPLPRDGVPIRSRKDRDAAWVEVVEGLSQALQYRPHRDERIVDAPSSQVLPIQPNRPQEAPLAIGVIFTTTETPKYTYVEPEEYEQLRGYLANGSRLVVQGPSGSGKSSIVTKALAELKLTAKWILCSDDAQLAELVSLLAQPIHERLVIDEAHLLEPKVLRQLASRIFNQQPDGQITVIGLGDVRGALLDHINAGLREPLARRLMGIVLSSRRDLGSQARLEKLVSLGEAAANIQFTQARELIDAAGGSFYMMQLLCFFAATTDGVQTTQKVLKRVNKGIAEILPKILVDLKRDYAGPLSQLARTDEVTPPRGAAALLLWLLSRSPDGEVAVESARLEYPTLSKAFDWLLGGPLSTAIKTQHLTWLLEFEASTHLLRAHDPRFLFYLRFQNWSAFLGNTGHTDLRLGTDGLLHHHGAESVNRQPVDEEPPVVPTVVSPPPSQLPHISAGNVVVPPALADALQRRMVIPFAGAGVSHAVRSRDTGKPLFPDWKELLIGAAELLKKSGKDGYAKAVAGLVDIGDSESFLDAARRAQQGLGPVWFKYLREALDPPSQKAAPNSLALARVLWAFGSKLVITTNYDHVLRWACPDDLRQDQRTWDISAPAEFAAMLSGGLDRATIWHLHGYVDNLTNVILTADGYRRLYPENSLIKSAYEASLLTLRAILASRTLLFVGFSFTDEVFSEQVRFIGEIFGGASGPHYVMVEKSKLDLTRERLRGLSSIDLIPFDSHDALPAHLRFLAPGSP